MIPAFIRISLVFLLLSATSAFSADTSSEQRLDRLFTQLKNSETEFEARQAANQIDNLWRNAFGETAKLLLSRADDAIADQDFPLALDILDQLIALEPNFAEAWNRRATVYYLKDDYGHSLADIAVALSLEPRHFGALTGLGLMLEDLGEDEKAYEALSKALELNPFQDNVRAELEALEQSALGQPI
ncbi:MAG: tetratricopeptide repeat protein [Hyphomicrobiales bacterium]